MFSTLYLGNKMDLKYNIRITTPIGSLYTNEVDMNKCFSDVGVDSSLVFGIGSYAGNIDSQKIENNRVAVTGSSGFIGYNKSGSALVEVKNQVIFDMNPPLSMPNATQQTSVQIVTKNLITGSKHTYKPSEQHFNPESKGRIEISNIEKRDFVDTSYCNPQLQKQES